MRLQKHLYNLRSTIDISIFFFSTKLTFSKTKSQHPIEHNEQVIEHNDLEGILLGLATRQIHRLNRDTFKKKDPKIKMYTPEN